MSMQHVLVLTIDQSIKEIWHQKKVRIGLYSITILDSCANSVCVHFGGACDIGIRMR